MEKNIVMFGSEENGGLVFPELQMYKDRIMVLAKMLERIAKDSPLLSKSKSLTNTTTSNATYPTRTG